MDEWNGVWRFFACLFFLRFSGQPRGTLRENYVPDFIPHMEFPESLVERKAPLFCLGSFEIVKRKIPSTVVARNWKTIALYIY